MTLGEAHQDGGLENTFPDDAFKPQNLFATTMTVAILLALQQAKQQDDWPDIETPLTAHRWLVDLVTPELFEEATTRVSNAARRRRRT